MTLTKPPKTIVPRKQMGVSTKPPEIPQFNLQQLNMVQIAQDLSKMINQPNPRGWIRKKFQTWKLELDNERINQIATYVERIRAVNQSMQNLQYELFMSPQIISDMINGYYLEAQQKTELQIQEHTDKLHALEEQMKAREIANDRARAEIEQIRSSTRLTQLQGNLLAKIVNELDLENITPEQAFVLVKALNPMANAQVDFASQQMMIEAQIEKMKAEASRIRAEADKEYAQDEQDKFVHGQIRQRYNKPGNTPKS